MLYIGCSRPKFLVRLTEELKADGKIWTLTPCIKTLQKFSRRCECECVFFSQFFFNFDLFFISLFLYHIYAECIQWNVQFMLDFFAEISKFENILTNFRGISWVFWNFVLIEKLFLVELDFWNYLGCCIIS